MHLDDFDYELPPELIATEPAPRRDAARLLVLDRTSGRRDERTVAGLPGLLAPGDLLVLNDTRVLPARLFGAKESGGKVELFLVRRQPECEERWECLVRASKSPRPGTRLLLPDGVTATVLDRLSDESRLVDFSGTADFPTWLERVGNMPLPPYLRRQSTDADRQRYQTVFAREPGAVAAPTAGLHFTPELLERIEASGVAIATLTLHVGLGTFMPVRVEDPRQHRMHRERFSIPEATAAAVQQCKERGGRVVAVGTTAVRTLEYAAADDGRVRPGAGEADIFIYPGYRFKVVDAMMTNFHLPKSTLLMLVAAFAGREMILETYREAVAQGFRFYSYGDAMFIY